MGGCRCSFRNCTNTTKTRDNLHFFHYPVKHKERCRQWIENANKPQFYDLDEDQLRNKVICETHFEAYFFPNAQKKRLLQGAIPTLDGDCEVKHVAERSVKVQDVQVLPANADGTIFVLETNSLSNNFQSAKVESYIYTNNGLVLPINKCNAVESVQTIFSDDEIDEIGGIKVKTFAEDFPTTTETLNADKESDENVEEGPCSTTSNLVQPLKIKRKHKKSTQKHEVEIPESKMFGEKYIDKINKNTRDIAMLKRIIKSRTVRHSNSSILSCLKARLPPTLYNIVSYQLNNKCDDLDCFQTIHGKSPQVYQILSDDFHWKLPNPEHFHPSTSSKNNGHLYEQ